MSYLQYFRYEIGDIVKENEVIAWYDESPMTGIVIKIQRNFYHFYSDMSQTSQDRLTILWLAMPVIEDLPSDLVYLVLRPE